LTELLTLFLNNLLPIILMAGAGFFLARGLKLNPRTLSQVIFYIFSPCLVFMLLTHSELANDDILSTMVFAGSFVLLVGGIAWAAGRLLKLDRRMLAAVMITSMLMNAGNYGLPVTQFAFGETALAYAALIFVVMSMLGNSAGVLIASAGSASLKDSLLGLLRLPATYALLFGIIFVQFNWILPLPLDRTVNLLGNAASPAMLILLGMQLTNVRWNGLTRALSLAAGIRLIVSPLLALGLCYAFGVSGPLYQASVLQSAMPTAVMTTMLATEFDTEPTFVTTVVMVTTLLSPLTITPLLSILGA
jgi:predicted permease